MQYKNRLGFEFAIHGPETSFTNIETGGIRMKFGKMTQINLTILAITSEIREYPFENSNSNLTA